ncbi:MAG TPA: 50S ribosomal protein L11 methyltransferase [Bacillales bacterium]|nr:50S ribosomal protein L11 methyltransferase [Bacillales bacterium]
MKWAELSIHSTQEAVEPISNIMHEAGASGVVIEDPHDLVKVWDMSFGESYELNSDDYPKEGVVVKAYLPVNSFLTETVEGIKASINGLTAYDIDIGRNFVMINEVKEEEWATAWKKYYKPVKVSEKITVIPTWEDYQSAADEIIVELDPGMAFGTGTHPTTKLCLRALEKVIRPGNDMIDVGAGSGVLSIAAAKLGAAKVTAFDLDDVAVQSAKLNVELNKVQDVVSVEQNNLLDNVKDPADVITANLLAEIILRFPEEAAQQTKPGGYFIASGIIQAKSRLVENALTQQGFTIEEILEMDDWVALIARNGR